MNWTCQCHRCVRSREVFRPLLVGAVLMALVLLITGCDGVSTAKPHIDYAIAVCEPNVGLARITVESAPSNSRRVTAYCNNGVVATKIMEAK